MSFWAFGGASGQGLEHPAVRELVYQLDQSRPTFLLGSGNHVAGNGRTQFLDILRYRSWWQKFFFPALGPGENAAYGQSVRDYGAAAQFLYRNPLMAKALDGPMRSGAFAQGRSLQIEFPATASSNQKKPASYLVKIAQNGFRIWLWHLYAYPHADGQGQAPHPQTLRWLSTTLEQMVPVGQPKSDRDIAIVMSHGHRASWLAPVASTHLRKRVSRLVDVVISGQGSQPGEIFFAKQSGMQSGLPLQLRVPAIDGESPVVLVGQVAANPPRLYLAYHRLGDDYRRLFPAYVKYLGVRGILRRIQSPEDWQRERRLSMDMPAAH
jgi:hypothetical protein